jgi:transcriptional regulator with XRE-family HTH domain
VERSGIAGAIYGRRMELGLSQAAVGRVVGVTSLTVSRWEAAAVQPHELNYKGLAMFLGKTVDEVRALCAHKEVAHGEG